MQLKRTELSENPDHSENIEKPVYTTENVPLVLAGWAAEKVIKDDEISLRSYLGMYQDSRYFIGAVKAAEELKIFRYDEKTYKLAAAADLPSDSLTLTFICIKKGCAYFHDDNGVLIVSLSDGSSRHLAHGDNEKIKPFCFAGDRLVMSKLITKTENGQPVTVSELTFYDIATGETESLVTGIRKGALDGQDRQGSLLVYAGTMDEKGLYYVTEEIGKDTGYTTHSVIWYLDLNTAIVKRIADGGYIYGYVSGDEETLISAGFTENVTEDREDFSLKIADECQQQAFAEINGRFYLNTARVDGVSDRMYMAESDYGYQLYLLDTTRHKLVRYRPFTEEGKEAAAKMYWRAEDEEAVIACYQDKAYVFSSGAPQVLEITWTMMELQEAEDAKKTP